MINSRASALMSALLVMAAGCGTPRPELAREAPPLSRPSGVLAFVSDRDGNAEIYVMNADGSRQERLTRDPGPDLEPAWSPDGNRLAFARGSEGPSESEHGDGETSVFVTGDGGDAVRVTDDSFALADAPTWSHDGKQIGFKGCCDAGYEIYAVPASGGAARQISNEPDDGASGAFYPAWSPDGAWIAHERVRYDAASQSDSEALYLMRPDGSDVRRISPEFFFDGRSSWSPDGLKIAFAARRDQENSQIYLLDVESGEVSLLIDDPGASYSGPSWSPDGTALALSSDRDGDAEIYVASSDGSRVRQLTDNSFHDTSPAWGPGPVEPSASPGPSPAPSDESPALQEPPPTGFHPAHYREGDRLVMPLTFVDGTTAELTFPPSLGLQDFGSGGLSTGGLGGIDRNLSIGHGYTGDFGHRVVNSYEGFDGGLVQEWESESPDGLETHLIFRFGGWHVRVRTYQDTLTDEEKQTWARSLVGTVATAGFLVVRAEAPLGLQKVGEHLGPQMWMRLTVTDTFDPFLNFRPDDCDPSAPEGDDRRTMEDGTIVSFSRLGGDGDYFATWCDGGGTMVVQVSSTDRAFVEGAAQGLRFRGVHVSSP